MKIAKKRNAKEVNMGTATAYEYSELDSIIHGAVVKLRGRYPEKGRVVNEEVHELGYVINGSGKIIIEGEEVQFEEGDQILIKPGEKYYWEANATIFMPCTPAWYPEQHKNVD